MGRTVGGAAERAIGDIEEQDAEDVHDGFDALDQRTPAAIATARSTSAPAMPMTTTRPRSPRRHEEVREQEREQEHVVERERALDQVDRHPLACGAAAHCDRRRDRAGQQQPADAPEDRLPRRALGSARTDAARARGRRGRRQPRRELERFPRLSRHAVARVACRRLRVRRPRGWRCRRRCSTVGR